MAEVFRARQHGAAGAEREVVLKQVLPFAADDPTHVELFIAEARLTLKLSHGNIVQVFEFGEAEGRYFLAMEFVDGVSLGDVLRDAERAGLPKLPPAIAIAVMQQVCRGLQYAHTRKDEKGRALHIVHRDVSPDNVLLGYDGQVKLADFGIARAAMVGRAKTDPGVFRGKFAYSAPEQARAEEVDGRADVYAVGVVLSQCLLGFNPQKELALKIASGAERVPAFPPSLAGPALAKLIDTALEPLPDARTPSALALEQQLSQWAAKNPVLEGHDLIVEFLAWLYPQAAQQRGHEASAAMRAWLAEGGARPPVATLAPGVMAAPTAARKRATDLVSPPVDLARASTLELPIEERSTEPLPTDVKSPSLKREARALALVVGTVLAVAAGVWAIGGFEEDPTAMKAIDVVEAAPPAANRATVRPPSVPVVVPASPTPKTPVPSTPAKPSVPDLPMEGLGSPSNVVLSSLTHAVDLSQAGFGMQPEDPNAPWALRTTFARSVPNSQPGVLFAALLDENRQLVKLTTVGSEWRPMEGKSARLFMMNPGSTYGIRTYDVALGTQASGVWVDQPGKRRTSVAFDALSGVDTRRFVLSALDAHVSQTITLRGAPGFSVAPVVACFINQRDVGRLDMPVHQLLLEVDKPVTLREVSRVAFVVPTTPGVPELRAIVEVVPGAVKRSSAGPQKVVSLEQQADEEESSGLIAENKQDWVEAAKRYDACFQLMPTRKRCEKASLAAQARIRR